MLLTEGVWCLAGLRAKGTSEGALIVKPAIERNGAGRVVGGNEILAGRMDALADQVANWRFAQEFSE